MFLCIFPTKTLLFPLKLSLFLTMLLNYFVTISYLFLYQYWIDIYATLKFDYFSFNKFWHKVCAISNLLLFIPQLNMHLKITLTIEEGVILSNKMQFWGLLHYFAILRLFNLPQFYQYSMTFLHWKWPRYLFCTSPEIHYLKTFYLEYCLFMSGRAHIKIFIKIWSIACANPCLIFAWTAS